MKRLLLPLIAILALSISVNAESYKAGVARIQWPKMKRLLDNTSVFLDNGDIDTACSKLREFDLLLGMNFEGLQELYPNGNWFGIKKRSNETLKEFC